MLNYLTIFIFAFVAIVSGLNLYMKVVPRNKVISCPNFRTLHSSVSITVRGAIFSLVFVYTTLYFWI